MRTLFAGLTALIMFVPLATADECDPEATILAPDGTYYSIDNDLCQPNCLFSIWVYADDDPDPCGPEEEANTIIF